MTVTLYNRLTGYCLVGQRPMFVCHVCTNTLLNGGNVSSYIITHANTQGINYVVLFSYNANDVSENVFIVVFIINLTVKRKQPSSHLEKYAWQNEGNVGLKYIPIAL
mgnify:CR=1 FL=1